MLTKLLGNKNITGCCLLDKKSFALVCQNWDVDDPLVTHETRVITCDLSKQAAEAWNSFDVGEAVSMYCCPVYKPAKGWLFVTDASDVLFCAGSRMTLEEKIPDKSPIFIFNVKCVDDGYAYAVGPMRSVYRRTSSDSWVKLERGLTYDDEDTEMGFDCLDAFDANDIYAGGGSADLWRLRGEYWSRITMPTNLSVKYLCCGKDGKVYVVTQARNRIFCGSDDKWFEIEKHENTNEILGSMTWFDGRLILLTTRKLYQVSVSGFEEFDVSESGLTSFSQMASTEDILMLANDKEVAIYDKVSWRKIN